MERLEARACALMTYVQKSRTTTLPYRTVPIEYTIPQYHSSMAVDVGRRKIWYVVTVGLQITLKIIKVHFYNGEIAALNSGTQFYRTFKFDSSI